MLTPIEELWKVLTDLDIKYTTIHNDQCTLINKKDLNLFRLALPQQYELIYSSTIKNLVYFESKAVISGILL